MGYVYKITNTINNKAYIGISTREPEKGRVREHLSGKGNRIIANAVKKYGKDAFTYEILEANVFDEFLPDLEVAYIAKFNTVRPHGYNLTYGGEVGKELSRETRLKISISLKGSNNSNFGKKFSTEHRRKIAEARKGKKHTAQAIQKMSEAKKGKKHTAQTRQKMSKAREGKKFSPETCRKLSEAKKHPDHNTVRDFFFSLPLEMPLPLKRQLLFTTFPHISRATIYPWVRRWQPSD